MISKVLHRLKGTRRAAPSTDLDEAGYLGPLPLSTHEHVEAVYAQYAELRKQSKNRHVDNPHIRAIFSDPAIMSHFNAYSEIPFVLWRTSFFAKGINDKSNAEIGWHHDKHFQSAGSAVDFHETGAHLSVLVALRDMTAKNGALEVIPGSHKPMDGLERDNRPFNEKSLEEHFLSLPEHIERRRVQITLKAGEFLLFHSALLHRSLPYRSGAPRVSLAGRLVRGDVEMPQDVISQHVSVPLHAAI